MSTHYEVLGLPEAVRDDQNLSAQTIRNAYRRALLQNHPDKSTDPKAKRSNFSIDQIAAAFSTLSDRKCREEYDKELKQKAVEGRAQGKDIFRTGIEIVDLDDMETDEAEGIWYRSCRCGDERGYSIRELDLEEAADEGEISVGCRGCSLWLKVLFGVMVDGAPESDTKLEEARERAPGKLSSSS